MELDYTRQCSMESVTKSRDILSVFERIREEDGEERSTSTPAPLQDKGCGTQSGIVPLVSSVGHPPLITGTPAKSINDNPDSPGFNEPGFYFCKAVLGPDCPH